MVPIDEYHFDEDRVRLGFDAACDRQIAQGTERISDYGGDDWRIVVATDGRAFAAALELALAADHQASAGLHLSRARARELIALFCDGPVVIT